jgi:hypothetical protein
MRAGCAARSFFQFLIGYSEIEKVDDVFSTVGMLVHGNGSCPSTTHSRQVPLWTKPAHCRYPTLEHCMADIAAHLCRSKRQKSKSARSHARGRRWIGSGTNGKPSVRRQLLPDLAVVLSSRHAARNHLRDTDHDSDDARRFRSKRSTGYIGRAKFLAHRTRKQKNDRAIDRTYQSAIKRLPETKKEIYPWVDVRPAPPAATEYKQYGRFAIFEFQ